MRTGVRRVAIGAAALTAGITLLVLRPILWSSAVDAPERFDEVASAVAFNEVARAAGLDHVHHKVQLDARLAPIMPWVASVGAAAAAADYDGDGWMDLYVTQSRKGVANHLYRNRGDGTFEDVARRAGVADVNDAGGASMDCVWGDYDNDGDPDLFVVRWGRDRLFRNEGDGSFREVTTLAFVDESGAPGSPWANGCAAAWVDYDGDALLDLYVGNYFAPHDLWRLEHTRIMHDSFERSRNAGRNSLFHNNGDGTFTDVAPGLGLDDPGWTLSVGHGDVDNDGWPDIYCADDFGTDQLFLNNGDGTFRDITEQALGLDTRKGMNVDFGDYDADGWLDVYVTNITTTEYLRECNMLWHNRALSADGVPLFIDESIGTGTCDGGWGWGAKFLDYDNDGDQDLVALNGFITAGEGSYWFDLASWTVTGDDVTDALNWPPLGDNSFSGREPTRLWRNDRTGFFVETAEQAGIDDHGDGRGVVTFDYDNDGDLDLYFANQGQSPSLYRNEVGASGSWMELALTGRPDAGSNLDAIGARVTVVTSDGAQIRELDGGNSYAAQSDRRLHFGLGDALVVDTLEVRWPSRRMQVLRNVLANQIVAIEEPRELPAATSLIPTKHGAPSPPPTAPEEPRASLSPEERVTLLAALEERVRARPEDVALASRYRARCVELGEHERSEVFFEALAEARPSVPNVRLQLSAAYVDKIPTCGGMAAIVSKGTLARQGLDQLDALIAADPSWWPAVYSRAMNHLHWPRALLHSDAAADDFRTCLELQKGSSPRTYFVRSYIGLGDALTKAGDFSAARAAWDEGAKRFPGDPELSARAELASAGAALAFVEAVRNLEQQVDTDYSFLMRP